MYLPSFVSACVIVLWKTIYRKIAYYLVDAENHQLEQDHENSLIQKMYLFQFVNSYFSSFLYCFAVNTFTSVAINLISILAVQQIGYNLIEWIGDKCSIGRKIRKIGEKDPYKRNTDQIDHVQAAMKEIRSTLAKNVSMTSAEKSELWKDYNKNTA